MAERKKENSWEKKLEEKVAELEKRIERMGKQAEAKLKTAKTDVRKKEHHGHMLFWGIVLIVVGIIWLGNNLEWFVYEIPWIPVIMIAAGIHIILKNWGKEESADGDKTSDKKKKL